MDDLGSNLADLTIAVFFISVAFMCILNIIYYGIGANQGDEWACTVCGCVRFYK